MSSTFGSLWRTTTYGESHGGGVGVVIDGVPPRLDLDLGSVQAQLDRRRPGQSRLTTPRDEPDQVEVLSGLEDGLTLGTPLAMVVRNRDQRPGDYEELRRVPRPSHADFTYQAKYGIRAASGGGRASARETIGRVAAGAVAEQWLAQRHGVDVVAWVEAVGDATSTVDPDTVTRIAVDTELVRCPDAEAAARMISAIDAARAEKDSVGGVVACVCRGVPAGWGEPVFDKLEAMLAHAMLSLPAVKGFEIGSGFAGTRQRGSTHHDAFVARPDGTLGTATNRSGGVQGGISNGEPVVLRVAFKPPATIARAQSTADFRGEPVELAAPGRHDPCVVPRAVPIVEAMAALVLADAALRQAARSA